MRDDVFKRLKLWDDKSINRFDAESDLGGVSNTFWFLTSDGRWILEETSTANGRLVFLRIHHRDKKNAQELDWKKNDSRFPYFNGKVIKTPQENENRKKKKPHR